MNTGDRRPGQMTLPPKFNKFLGERGRRELKKMEGAKEESTLKKPKRGEEISLRAGSFGGGGRGKKLGKKGGRNKLSSLCWGGELNL